MPLYKRKEMNEKYNYLNQLVYNYREDLPNAANILLETFEPLITKYVKLCTKGIWNPNDYDTSSFIRMLSHDGNLQSNVEYLVKLLSVYSGEDILQEARLALLTTARKYTNICVNFKYVFKKQIHNLIKDPLVTNTMLVPDFLPDIQTYKSVQDEEKEINTLWVNGVTAGYGFSSLTPMQRAIIKLIYNDETGINVACKVLHISKRNLKVELGNAQQILLKFFRDDLKTTT